jgi:hypothetical protein
MRAALATSAAAALVLGLQEKKCHNVFAEPHPNDPEKQVALVEAPGSLQRNDFAGACRGMWQADGFASGKVLIAQGSTLSTYVPSTDALGTAITGTLPGSDRGDAAFAENGGVFLFDGKLAFSDGTYIRRATDGVLDDPNLAIGGTNTRVATGAFDYSINGTEYSKGAVAAGTVPGNDVVPLGLYGAVALDIGIDGTIDAIEAPANATGYASAALAAAALPAPEDAHIRIGYVTATKSDGAFTFGTTALNAANTTVAYTDSAVNTAFTDLITDAGEAGYTSVAVLGQRPLFTFGPRFGFGSVGTSFDLFRTTSALSYYTLESSPDNAIAVRVLGELAVFFGTKTIEFWAQTGDEADPFSIQPGMTQQVGCASRDGIVQTDNSIFFIDGAFNPRRLGTGGSQVINARDPWITSALKAAGAANIIGKTYEDRAHTFVQWRTPSICVVYDVLMDAWHTRGTNLSDTLRYTDMVQVGAADDARVFVCDVTGQFDELSRDYTTESKADAATDGTYIVREFSAFLPTKANCAAIKTVKLECAKGVGTATGQGADPVVQMRQSKDSGNTFTSWRSKGIGPQGEYSKRTIWRRRGRAGDQGIVFQFRKSDPVKTAYLGVPVNEDQTA